MFFPSLQRKPCRWVVENVYMLYMLHKNLILIKLFRHTTSNVSFDWQTKLSILNSDYDKHVDDKDDKYFAFQFVSSPDMTSGIL
jgi:hypothetical protein